MLPPPTELHSFAAHLADRARAITLHHFRQPLIVDNKADASPVTVADRECERLLRQEIAARFPDHAVLGEEHGSSGDSPYRWIIDPIDGTRSFISGFPIYCTLIALLENGCPLFSLIDVPALDERFFAAVGRPTTFNGVPVRCRIGRSLSQALCYSSDPTMFNDTQNRRREALLSAIAQQRYSGDGYCYAMLAAGWIDLVVEADMKPYDFLPLILIVEQAGGVISDWEGKALSADSNGEILAAATPELHRLAVAALAEKRSG